MDMDIFISKDGEQIAEKSTRKKWSRVWDHFTKDEHTRKARCNYCGSLLSADNKKHGTSHLRRHISNCRKRPYEDASTDFQSSSNKRNKAEYAMMEQSNDVLEKGDCLNKEKQLKRPIKEVRSWNVLRYIFKFIILISRRRRARYIPSDRLYEATSLPGQFPLLCDRGKMRGWKLLRHVFKFINLISRRHRAGYIPFDRVGGLGRHSLGKYLNISNSYVPDKYLTNSGLLNSRYKKHNPPML